MLMMFLLASLLWRRGDTHDDHQEVGHYGRCPRCSLTRLSVCRLDQQNDSLTKAHDLIHIRSDQVG
jgi:hypothetical protein